MKFRRGMKTFVALMLVCGMVLLSFPGMTFAVDLQMQGKKGEDFCTNTYIAEKIQEILDDLVYSDAPYFTVSGRTSCGNVLCAQCSLSNVCAEHPNIKKRNISFDISAYGSGAFARYALALIFDTKISAINYFGNPVTDGKLQTIGRVSSGKALIVGSYDDMTEENLQAVLQKGTTGDLIQARNSKGGNHSMILLSSSDSDVYVLHSIDYAVDGVEFNRVVVSRMTYGEMISSWDQVISLIRVDDSSYAAAYAKGETVHTTHIYTDEGQDACTVCGEKFYPKTTVTGAGVYMARDAARIYRGYYRSTGTTGTTVQKGKFIEAVGSVVNSTGKTFYLLSDGGYAAAEDFETATRNVPTINIGTYPLGNLPVGKSFDLSGTVSYASGLSYVTGYLLNSDAKIVQSVRAAISSTSYNIYSGAINAQLRFAVLDEGNYVYMVVACGKDGAMYAFKSSFSMVKAAELPTPAAPSAPTLASKTSSSVTLRAVSGYEYRMNSGNWQTSPTFSNLQPGTTYSFYQRVAATSSSKESSSSPALQVTTEKGTAGAPSAPVLASKTSTSVTLRATTGYEYRMNSGNWQTSPIFSNLQPGTTYSFYQRIASTSTANASPSSPALQVTTDKKTVPAPSAPVLSSKTSTSVTLRSTAGYEYRINSDNWQTSPTFSNLQPGTTYSFYQRIASTSTANASPSSPALQVTTDKRTVSTPAAPTLLSSTPYSVTLRSVTGYEYRLGSGTWQTSPTFTDLQPGRTYSFYQRVAETSASYASSASSALTVTTPKKTVNPPPALSVKTVGDTSIELNSLGSGVEYSRDNGRTWQPGTVFTGLISNTSYTFVARYAETSDAYASPLGAQLKVKTDYSKQSAPPRPTLRSVVEKTVTLSSESGLEYSVDGGSHWQTSPVFTVSTYGTYKFVARRAANERCYASPASEPLSVDVHPTFVTSDRLTVDEDSRMISDVTVGTTGDQLLGMLHEGDYVTLYEPDGSKANGQTNVKSGMILELPGGERYTLVVRGDVDGDGLITVFDLTLIKRYIVDGVRAKMNDYFFLAADVTGEGDVDIFDYTSIRKNILDGGEL